MFITNEIFEITEKLVALKNNIFDSLQSFQNNLYNKL